MTRMRLGGLAIVLVAISLAGCVDQQADTHAMPGAELPPARAADSFEAKPPHEPAQSGSETRPHGEPKRSDGSVETELATNAPGWRATQQVTISNDFGGASWSDLAVDNSAGSVTIQPWDQAGYLVTVVLEARGTTEEEARRTLQTMHVVHRDQLGDDRLNLATDIQYDQTSTPIGTIDINSGRAATVVVQVPSAPGFDVNVDVSSADVLVKGLAGGRFVVDASSGDTVLEDILAERFEFDSSSGDVTFTGRADQIQGDASSGDVTIEAIANDVDIHSSSGDLVLDLSPAASGGYELGSSSGDIELRVPASDRHGYDVVAETSSGDIRVELEDTQTSQHEDRAEAITIGFSQRPIQVQLMASTSSGDISVAN